MVYKSTNMPFVFHKLEHIKDIFAEFLALQMINNLIILKVIKPIFFSKQGLNKVAITPQEHLKKRLELVWYFCCFCVFVYLQISEIIHGD